MSTERANAVRVRRVERGWSQHELARRTGLSRTGISAIEAGRLVPSVHAALALAAAFGCRVEELFRQTEPAQPPFEWAGTPPLQPGPFWRAEVSGRRLAYSVHDTGQAFDWHDGVSDATERSTGPETAPERTLVIAGCDPAVALLAAEYRRTTGFRLLCLQRSSRQSLALLAAGRVHLAGIHLSSSGVSGNRATVQAMFGRDIPLVHFARWQTGLAVNARVAARSVSSLVRRKTRWVGREEGSGARQCLDEILAGRSGPSMVARDHRGVAAAVANDWADAGVTLRLTCDEANVQFLPIREEDYQFCAEPETLSDPRCQAFLNLIRSPLFRRRLQQLPGYDSARSGDLC